MFVCVIELTKVTWLEELAPGGSLSLDGLGGFMVDLKEKRILKIDENILKNQWQVNDWLFIIWQSHLLPAG